MIYVLPPRQPGIAGVGQYFRLGVDRTVRWGIAMMVSRAFVARLEIAKTNWTKSTIPDVTGIIRGKRFDKII
jgi:hypothetical protein